MRHHPGHPPPFILKSWGSLSDGLGARRVAQGNCVGDATTSYGCGSTVLGQGGCCQPALGHRRGSSAPKHFVSIEQPGQEQREKVLHICLEQIIPRQLPPAWQLQRERLAQVFFRWGWTCSSCNRLILFVGTSLHVHSGC